jgi:putative hydrolase of the HAD superfamily
MPIKALTLDYWDTIFRMESEVSPKIIRLEKMKALLHFYNLDLTDEQWSELYNDVWNKFEKEWKEKYYTMTTAEIIDYVLNKLNIKIPQPVFEELTKHFQEAILKNPPLLMENAKTEIEKLSKVYKLAIISDTGFTPGKILRSLLEAHELLKCFDVFVFSDEFGRSKPHPDTFMHVANTLGIKPEEMAHIGDNERTDIGGAISIGMKAILFTKGKNGIPIETKATAIMNNWAEIGGIVSSF